MENLNTRMRISRVGAVLLGDSIKQLMAFPLFATVAWLVWVFGHQTGVDGILRLLLGLTLAGAAAWVYGKDGSVEVTMADAIFYYEPKRASSPVSEVMEQGVATGATFSIRGEMPYRGAGSPVKVPEGTEGNPNLLACKSFIESVRNNVRPFADERVGWGSGVSVYLANQAIEAGRRIMFADHVKT